MKEWLVVITEHAIVMIDAIAVIIVVIGTLEALYNVLRLILFAPGGHDRRDAWLRYAHWLVAALTFQLAADIIETSITTSWEAIGRLAIVAVVRTFLNYFLERDLSEVRERQHESDQASERPQINKA